MNSRATAVLIVTVLLTIAGCSESRLFRRLRCNPCHDCPPGPVLAGPAVHGPIDPYSPVSLGANGPYLQGTPAIGGPISGPILPAVPPLNGTPAGPPIIYPGPAVVQPPTGPGGDLLLPMPTPEGKVPPLVTPPKTTIPDARPMPYVPPADPSRLNRPSDAAAPSPPARF
jgi:hypothetical protein